MPTLQEVLENHSEAVRQEVVRRLNNLSGASGSNFQAHSAIIVEHRLTQDAWQDFIIRISTCADNELDLRLTIRDFCRKWILRGGDIPDPLNEPNYGRAVTLEAFVGVVRKVNPRLAGRAKKHAQKEVRDLYLKDLELTKPRWRTRKLGMFLMWSTYDRENASPFRRLPSTADGIRRVLGLHPRFKGRPLLLLEYDLPADVKPLYPTIADAYAGDEWSYFFRPAPPGALHGMTMPWPTFANRTKPRPEIVHPVITGEHLQRKPKRLT
jgi:hypothetical protein